MTDFTDFRFDKLTLAQVRQAAINGTKIASPQGQYTRTTSPEGVEFYDPGRPYLGRWGVRWINTHGQGNRGDLVPVPLSKQAEQVMKYEPWDELEKALCR